MLGVLFWCAHTHANATHKYFDDGRTRLFGPAFCVRLSVVDFARKFISDGSACVRTEQRRAATFRTKRFFVCYRIVRIARVLYAYFMRASEQYN